MANKLCGTLIIYNGVKQDYCFIESINCLQSLCDYVIVVDCGSQDNTIELLKEVENDKTLVIYREKSEWDLIKGREKLSYYTNIGIDKAAELGYEWQFNLQGDEIIHEDSFPYIRAGICMPDVDGYWSKRINLFGNSQHELSVGHDRLPVGIEIIRLTKTKFHSIDDAQSIDCQQSSWELLNYIRIYHMGFVRSKYVHTKKIKHMITEVFLMDGDPKVEAMGDVFDCWGLGFSKEDVKPITEPLPKFIKEWAEQRDKINNFVV